MAQSREQILQDVLITACSTKKVDHILRALEKGARLLNDPRAKYLDWVLELTDNEMRRQMLTVFTDFDFEALKETSSKPAIQCAMRMSSIAIRPSAIGPKDHRLVTKIHEDVCKCHGNAYLEPFCSNSREYVSYLTIVADAYSITNRVHQAVRLLDTAQKIAIEKKYSDYRLLIDVAKTRNLTVIFNADEEVPLTSRIKKYEFILGQLSELPGRLRSSVSKKLLDGYQELATQFRNQGHKSEEVNIRLQCFTEAANLLKQFIRTVNEYFISDTQNTIVLLGVYQQALDCYDNAAKHSEASRRAGLVACNEAFALAAKVSDGQLPAHTMALLYNRYASLTHDLDSPIKLSEPEYVEITKLYLKAIEWFERALKNADPEKVTRIRYQLAANHRNLSTCYAALVSISDKTEYQEGMLLHFKKTHQCHVMAETSAPPPEVVVKKVPIKDEEEVKRYLTATELESVKLLLNKLVNNANLSNLPYEQVITIPLLSKEETVRLLSAELNLTIDSKEFVINTKHLHEELNNCRFLKVEEVNQTHLKINILKRPVRSVCEKAALCIHNVLIEDNKILASRLQLINNLEKLQHSFKAIFSIINLQEAKHALESHAGTVSEVTVSEDNKFAKPYRDMFERMGKSVKFLETLNLVTLSNDIASILSTLRINTDEQSLKSAIGDYDRLSAFLSDVEANIASVSKESCTKLDKLKTKYLRNKPKSVSVLVTQDKTTDVPVPMITERQHLQQIGKCIIEIDELKNVTQDSTSFKQSLLTLLVKLNNSMGALSPKIIYNINHSLLNVYPECLGNYSDFATKIVDGNASLTMVDLNLLLVKNTHFCALAQALVDAPERFIQRSYNATLMWGLFSLKDMSIETEKAFINSEFSNAEVKYASQS